MKIVRGESERTPESKFKTGGYREGEKVQKRESEWRETGNRCDMMKRLSFLFLALLQAALASFPNQGGGKISPLSSPLFPFQNPLLCYGEKSFAPACLRDGPFSKFGLDLTLTFREQILHKWGGEGNIYKRGCWAPPPKNRPRSNSFMTS